MPVTKTYTTYTLERDGEPHLCNKHNCQQLVDADPTLIDPLGEFVNAENAAARKAELEQKAKDEAEAAAAEAKRIADEEQARLDEAAAKDKEIADLRKQLSEAGGDGKTTEAKAAPKRRGGGRPAPKSADEQPKEDSVAAAG